MTALTPGEDYQFRVIARNAIGTMSKPSQPTEKVIPHDEFVAPQIMFDKELLDGIYTRNEKLIVLKAQVTGKPAPRIWRTHNGTELIPSNNMEIETKPNLDYSRLSTTGFGKLRTFCKKCLCSTLV